jgi:hypothetical protein
MSAVFEPDREADLKEAFRAHARAGYWRPRLILVEDLAMNLSRHRDLRSRGYKWMRRTGQEQVGGFIVICSDPSPFMPLDFHAKAVHIAVGLAKPIGPGCLTFRLAAGAERPHRKIETVNSMRWEHRSKLRKPSVLRGVSR